MLKQLTKEGYKISFLFHGDDWKEVKGQKYIESIGGKMILLPYRPVDYKITSKVMPTTEIIKEVCRRYGKSP